MHFIYISVTDIYNQVTRLIFSVSGENTALAVGVVK